MGFLCIGTKPWLWQGRLRRNVVPIPRLRRRGDTAQTLSPEATLCCNDYSINYSWTPAFHMRHPPSPFSRDDKPRDKGVQKCQNCDIHFSEIVSLFCKIASYIMYPSKTCHLFNITWQGLNSWEIAGVDPHSNCRGFDESICRLVSSACVTGANCVCIGFIISNITCRPTLPHKCVI